jgi:hypothetical protein
MAERLTEPISAADSVRRTRLQVASGPWFWRGTEIWAKAMNNKGHERITDEEQLANRTPANDDDAHLAEPAITENQNGLPEEVERLRLEVERLREQQQAFTRTPQSNDLPVNAEVENDQTDEAHPTDPGNRGRALRHPARLVLALVVAAPLFLGGDSLLELSQVVRMD